MKFRICFPYRQSPAFTLIEILLVIAIIGILAAMVMTVIPKMLTWGKVTKAKTEMSQMVTAIERYESVYSHLPTTNTFKGTVTWGGSVLANAGFSGAATNPNSEVMAILRNVTDVSVTDVNRNSQMNSQKTVFLFPNLSSDTSSPGLGPDLIYRDPWGNPYVISINLNADTGCEDAFYRQAAISGGGLKGLVLQADANYSCRGRIMVWSAGPDGKIDNSGTVKANEGVNKDNVLSW